ncbi:MAG: hypothetical protein JW971_05310 [Synergistales bacterium]|nr:hypothetical protein [Synergistales bacterium]
MFRDKWKKRYALILIAVSLVLYVLHFLIFHDTAFIFRLMINNLAFAPISVLFVTLFINEIMDIRNRQERIQRSYLALGTFFHEMGTELLYRLSRLDTRKEVLEEASGIDESWQEKDFEDLKKTMASGEICLSCGREHLASLSALLLSEKDQIVQMLANPALKEHDFLTDMLWSVYHLCMELLSRGDLTSTTGRDLDHLEKDAERAYGLLCIEWIEYMKHLKEEYPYLFSFASRTNPFREERKVTL